MPNLENILFIQANSFFIFTCSNPVLPVLGFGQMGKCEDCAMFFVFGEIVQRR
jgi:hypothetical protein